MINSLDKFYEEAAKSVILFDEFSKRNGLNKIAIADHICYKCNSSDVFESMRRMFEENSKYLHQSIISKRRIAYIKLDKPIKSSLGDISFVELSDQKPDKSQTNRFDHIEIYPSNGNYASLVSVIEDLGVPVEKVVRPHHTTHDVDIGGFLIRLTEEPLIDKIKKEEMR